MVGMMQITGRVLKWQHRHLPQILLYVELNHLILYSPLYTVSQKKRIPPLACYNFDAHERILIFFDRNATDKVSSQNMLYYATSNNLCFCTTLQNGKHESGIFFTGRISASSELNQLLLDFFSVFDSRLNHAAVWLPKSCNQCVQLGAFGVWFRRKEVDSATAVGLCCTHKAPVRYLLGFLFSKVMQKH